MPLLNKFRELSLRDQAMLVLLALALVMYVFYQAAWRPLANANDNLARSNSALRENVQSMTTLAAEYQQLRQAGGRRRKRWRNYSTALSLRSNCR